MSPAFGSRRPAISARFASFLWQNDTALAPDSAQAQFLDATAVPQIVQRTTIDQ
jgi:hypothetical protein